MRRRTSCSVHRRPLAAPHGAERPVCEGRLRVSDIVRSAIAAQMTEVPLCWRKDAPDHWSASAGPDLTVSAWPSRGSWQWALVTRDDREISTGKADCRRTAMDAAEKAAKEALPTPTDVQIVAGWLAHRGEVPADVLQAALRLSERDKAERKAKRPAQCQGGGG